MKDLIKKIEQWSIERGLHTADPMKQYDKLIEEHGELMKGLNKQDEQMIKDSIGDMFVVMTIMTQQIGSYIGFSFEKSSSNDDKSLKVTTTNYMGLLYTLGATLENLGSHDLVTTSIDKLIYLLNETAKQHDTDLKTCVQLAYDEIKNRKGKIVDGQFIKEEDL